MDYSPHALLDLRFPDFKARHIFSAKLRLVIIASFWLVIGMFYPDILLIDQPIMLIISMTFVVTTICHAFILKGIWPVFFFIIELAADSVAQTTLVYLTGGPISNYFTIYIIYACSGGLFFNYRVASVMSGLSLFFYTLLIVSISLGWLEPFTYAVPQAGILYEAGVFRNLLMMAFSLLLVVYAVWISTHFTMLRERALEEKNRELIALNKMSSVTRSIITLERVIQELLRGVREGMGYEDAFLLIQDTEGGKMPFYFNETTFVGEALKGIWKTDSSTSSIFLPLQDQNNQIYQAMLQRKLIIRNQMVEVMKSFSPEVDPKELDHLQKRFGLRKFLAAPLVAEGKVLGALIGVSRDVWITQEAVRAFEGFADQAALTIDNTMLISELKKKNIELERVSRVKSEFLATMSHELRTPLTAIIGFSELLMEEVVGALTTEQKESLKEIHVNGENLLYMINGLLDLAKIESGKMEISVSPIFMPELVDRVQRMISSLIQKKNHHLVVKVQENFPIVYADERKIQQTLLNLLSNAIKFTPSGGTITVSVFVEPAGDHLIVEVQDTGVGIAEKHLQSIFEPFKQVDGSYTREYTGTGLGLALVKQFVEMQSGEVTVVSTVGQGSKFRFKIPSKST